MLAKVVRNLITSYAQATNPYIFTIKHELHYRFLGDFKVLSLIEKRLAKFDGFRILSLYLNYEKNFMGLRMHNKSHTKVNFELYLN